MSWKITMERFTTAQLFIANKEEFPDLMNHGCELRVRCIADNPKLGSYYIFDPNKEKVVGLLEPQIDWDKQECHGHKYIPQEDSISQ